MTAIVNSDPAVESRALPSFAHVEQKGVNSMGRYAMWKLDDPQKLRKQLLKLEQKLPGELEKALRKEAETAVRLANSRISEEKKELRKGWEIGGIQRQGETISVEIRHPSPEAAQLEHGSGTDGSLQQGQFMLALALAELERDWPFRLEQSISTLLCTRNAGICLVRCWTTIGFIPNRK